MKKEKGFIGIAIILVVLVIVGIGTVFVYKNSQFMTGKLTPASSETSPEKSEEPKDNNQVPEDWLIYDNPTYHYQVSYPPFFHVQGENEPPYPSPPTGMSFTHRWDNNEYCEFAILATLDEDGFDGEIENIRQRGEDVESQGTIDGVPAIIFDAMGGEAISRSYYVSKSGLHLRFGYNYKIAAKYSQDCADIVKQMVSSFKILN